MSYPFLVENGVVIKQIKSATTPPGWVTHSSRVALGSGWDGATLTPPPPPPPPTPEEIEADVQELAHALTAGGERDKAIAMVIADVVAKAFNIPAPDARQMVRDRLVSHLRNIKGI